MPDTSFSPLLWPCGEENMGGFTNRLVFVPFCALKAAPTLPKREDITNDDDYATAKGAFEFNDSTVKPTPLYATDKTVQYKADNQGDIDGHSYALSGQWFYPGMLKKASVFARKVNNTPGYLVLEQPGGDQIIVGQPGLPVSIAPAFDGGQARADRKGTTFSFTADSFVPYIFLDTPLDFDALFAAAEGTEETPTP